MGSAWLLSEECMVLVRIVHTHSLSLGVHSFSQGSAWVLSKEYIILIREAHGFSQRRVRTGSALPSDIAWF